VSVLGPINSEYMGVWHRVQEDLISLIYIELDSIKASHSLLEIAGKSADRKKLLGNIRDTLVRIDLFKSRVDNCDLRKQVEAEMDCLRERIFPNPN
jgi:hypothetical protein